MRKTQAIFRAVIRAGYYGPKRDYQSPYTCTALGKAHIAKCITHEEYARARKAIRRYIVALTNNQRLNVMRLALNRGAGQDHSTDAWEHGAGRDFYWNWDQSPRKTNIAGAA